MASNEGAVDDVTSTDERVALVPLAVAVVTGGLVAADEAVA